MLVKKVCVGKGVFSRIDWVFLGQLAWSNQAGCSELRAKNRLAKAKRISNWAVFFANPR